MKKTIIDVGACKGADTHFYLLKGFNVIAVESNPEMCNYMKNKFGDYIKDGRLEIIDCAIYDENDLKLDFYVNSFEEWSSLDIKSKAVSRNSFSKIKVNTITLDKILENAKNEVYYIKIDVEGGELKAISRLKYAKRIPSYISFEVNPDCSTILHELELLGFKQFKIVRQGKGSIEKKDRQCEGNFVDMEFKDHHSGYFGRDLGKDDWNNSNYIKDFFEKLYNGGWVGWYDVHARHEEST